MNKTLFALYMLYTAALHADAAVYCPQKAGLLQVGMSAQAVIQACGAPQNRQPAQGQLMRKVPVTQMFFENHGGSTALYGVWMIPGGYRNDGNLVPFGSSASGKVLEIHFSEDKVIGIKINGTALKTFSTCGTPISMGDDIADVRYACGDPAVENETTVTVPVSSKSKPELWIYNSDPYSPALKLWMVDGKVYSINGQ